MFRFALLCCCCLFFISCKNDIATSEASEETTKNNDTLTTVEAIAYKNGYEHWDSVARIQFTFNVDRGENHFERTWTWHPKKNTVMLQSANDTIQYNRSQLDSTSIKADQAFINDKYWLLAPFNLMWDEGTSFTEKKNVVAPISKDTLNQLTVTYSNEGGYTPGDAYDFFYSDDFIVREWIFRKGNDSVPTMATTWEDYETFNSIKIAKMHTDSTGTFKLYFSDISVQ
ncbi:hypothetical protein [Candidatus Ulvibacter alkanivorans]|uniref:hypothetical protein n=1 Tax=Candidatus Ulvibacter alkanivorans TaxID=2267620 RepID=UPI000DF204EB|nr:hypothetical protein [Candidatus Ulvibacter alkanivorans]